MFKMTLNYVNDGKEISKKIEGENFKELFDNKNNYISENNITFKENLLRIDIKEIVGQGH